MAWNGSAWIEQARLEPSDLYLGLSFGVDFGASVAIDGNRLIVGAPGDAPASAPSGWSNYGAVYVFERSGSAGAWIEKQKLRASDSGRNRYFGASVALRGAEILVGAPGAPGPNASEAAYFFNLNNGNWQQQGDPVTGTGDFGRSVALTAAYAVIGSPATPSGGAAAVYYVSAGSVSLWTTLTPSDTASYPQPDQQFGAAVAASSQVNRIVIGAPSWNDPSEPETVQQGRAFVFDFIGGNWIPVASLTAEGGLPEAEAKNERLSDGGHFGGHFGAAVALDSQYVVVGAPGHTAFDAAKSMNLDHAGTAYVFYELHDGTIGVFEVALSRFRGVSCRLGLRPDLRNIGKGRVGRPILRKCATSKPGVPGRGSCLSAVVNVNFARVGPIDIHGRPIRVGPRPICRDRRR